MTAGPEPHDGVDPLLAALLGEPPRAAPRDAEYLAEYRAARADLTLLREQLHLLADALTEEAPGRAAGPVAASARAAASGPAPESGPGAGAASDAVPVPGRRPARTRPAPGGPARPSRRSGGSRRARVVALRGLVAAGVASVALGFGWLAVQGGAGDGAGGSADKASAAEARPGGADGSGADGSGPAGDEGAAGTAVLADPGYLACARLVVEGDVTRAAPVTGAGEARVTLRVTRVYKADPPVKEAVVTLTGPLGLGAGDHVLVGVPRRAGEAGTWLVGERAVAPERERVARALPESRATGCG
ncbi:hypothetical protein [Streptomyces sp. NPDC018610]|uniref:hypothetical protein n=1 Tax=Streptomyces sp. NPDC018610 TaxID=3365049 RepID=UPI0037B18AE9